MLSFAGELSDVYAVKQIVDYLREKTDIPIIYPKERSNLLDSGYELYYKTDSHWNQIGGYIGARSLL